MNHDGSRLDSKQQIFHLYGVLIVFSVLDSCGSIPEYRDIFRVITALKVTIFDHITYAVGINSLRPRNYRRATDMLTQKLFFLKKSLYFFLD